MNFVFISSKRSNASVLGPRVEEAMHRSIRWLDRCIEGHKQKEHQNLFPIIQGGLNLEWRTACIKGNFLVGIFLFCVTHTL